MKFTDIFIRRPVLASVISLMLLVIGVKAFYALPVLEYPRTENAVVTITTVYYGADPETVAGFVTTPLENAIAQANGIDTLTSTSGPGVSTITANLVLNFDPDKAITEITAKINSVLNQLPAGVQQPTLTVAIGQSLDALIIGFASEICRRTRSPIISCATCSRGCNRCPACRRRSYSAGKALRCGRGWIRQSWRHTD